MTPIDTIDTIDAIAKCQLLTKWLQRIKNICSLSSVVLFSHFGFTFLFSHVALHVSKLSCFLFQYASKSVSILLKLAQTCSNLLKMSQSAILSNFEQF